MLLQGIATTLHVPYAADDFIMIPPPAGKGYIKIVCLFNELEVILLEVALNQPLIITRGRSDKHYFILHFDDVHITDTTKFKVDREILQKTNTRHTVASLTK